MEKSKKITINLLEGFKQEVYIGQKNKIADSYYVAYESDNNELFFCLINKDLTPITPSTNKMLVSYFYTEDKKNICLELKAPNEHHSNFYHFQKDKNHYRNVFSTENKQQIPFAITQTPFQEYWFIEDGEGKRSLYHPNTISQLTPFFDAINFVEDDSTHLALFESNIRIKDIENIKLFATSLVGFIDYQGRFSSQIYDTEKSIYQSEAQRFYTITGDNYRNDFINLLNNLTEKYQKFYDAKEEDITKTIEELYLVGLPKSIEISSNKKNKSKVLEFRKKEESK